jgi:hypothetical protein
VGLEINFPLKFFIYNSTARKNTYNMHLFNYFIVVVKIRMRNIHTGLITVICGTVLYQIIDYRIQNIYENRLKIFLNE